MLPQRLPWRLVPSYLLLIAVFTAVVLGSLSRSLHEFLLEEGQAEVESAARLIAARVEASGLPRALSPEAVAASFGVGERARLTVVAEDGLVLADSWESPSAMDDHADRPEIVAARASGVGRSARFSETIGADLVYAALPARLPDGRRVFVRMAVPAREIRGALATLSWRVGLAAAAVALASVVVGWAVSVRISRRLDAMRRSAERFAAGDFEHRVGRAGFEELDALGRALERMATQLDERLRTITAQSHEQQAVLSSMHEAVIAVDRDGAVLSMNGAAVELLGASGRRLESQPLQAVLRDSRIEALVDEVLATGMPAEVESDLRDGSERHLHVRGSLLRDAVSEAIGVVLVLNDVTRLRRLEQVRQEFVANVSHELRTPVTSIKGFVETLRDGALEDPERARHFLGIALRQADRLNAIIEDLLTLSRLESEGGGIELGLTRLRRPLEAAVEACAHGAGEKGIEVRLDCDPDLRGEVNAALLEQAVVNLVDNAVKFSGRGASVVVSARRQDEAVLIEVADSGPGIAREHLDRLFERFYRVDRARSRAEGGTGLGLAIVKHIAQAHGGSVSVRSRVGEGSTFTLHLPAG